jgi:DNA-binding CsgD family transcriptional regulator
LVATSDRQVVGREDELAHLRDFVAAVAQGPRALCIRGEPGIGKTTLWRAAIEAEAATRLRVLAARCVEAELPLAFVGLADLVRDDFPAVADELTEHDRAALAVAVGLAAPEGALDTAAVPRAFSALLRLLARDRPVLLAVDDVQWLDSSTGRALSFAARRIGDAPVGILVTQRGEGPDPLDLARAFEGTRFDELRVEPLSLGALAHLIRARVGVRIPRPALARVHDASGGNPMFALEFARSVARGSGPALAPLAVPASLRELVRDRIVEQPEEVRRLLAVAAAAERPTPSLLAAFDAEAPRLLDVAIDRGIVGVGDDGIVRFAHPLLASAAYAALPPSQRRALHGGLAGVADDVEERARHLALASMEPDAEVAAVLDEAAARAHARGAPETAAALAKEAARLTPPADVSAAGERAFAVASYLAAACLTADAARQLDRVLAIEREGPQRVRALLLRVFIEHDLEAAFRLLEEALEHAGDDPALRASVLGAVSVNELWFRRDLAASEAAAFQALAAAEQAGDPARLALMLVFAADVAHQARRPRPDLVDRALALEAVHGTRVHTATVRTVLGKQLLRDGDLNGARRLLERELRAVAGAGAEKFRAELLELLADLETHGGDWPLAARYLDDAWEIASDGDDLFEEAELLAMQARLAALRGDVDAGRRLVAAGIERADRMHWPYLATRNRWLLGSLELALGEPARAWPVLQDVVRTPTWAGLEVLVPLADAVETLAALGRLETVDELVETLEDEARNGHRWAGAAALRSRALCLLAQGEAAEAATLGRRAADAFEAAGFPLDRGRAQLVAGEALRRNGGRRLAAEQLEAAAAAFSALGARLWAQRAEQELRRARPRPRRDRGLTNAERQVAALVAAGKANREVAAQLFTTVATVEAHLTRIYRKLGVRSRTELARGVADGTLSLADD